MDLQISSVLGLALGVTIAGLVLVPAIGVVNAEGLEPGIEDANRQLNKLGTQTVTIDEAGEDNDYTAAKKMEGLMVYNMYAASHCAMTGQIAEMSFNPSGYRTPSVDLSGLSEDEKGFSWFAGFNSLFEGTEFRDDCKEILPSFLFGVEQAAREESRLPDFSMAEGRWQQPGKDLEGREGRISFNVEESFVLPRKVNGDRQPGIIAFKAEGVDTGQAAIPDFWRGKRATVMIPDGITDVDGDNWKRSVMMEDLENKGGAASGIQRYGDPAGAYSLYGARIRTRNVPVIATDSNEFASEGQERDQLEGLVDQARYYFCKGAQGYVQSNAGWGTMDNTGEAEQIEPVRKEQFVYPLVEVLEGSGCIEEGGPWDDQVFDRSEVPHRELGENWGGNPENNNNCGVKEAREREVEGVSDFQLGYPDSGEQQGEMVSAELGCGLREREIEFDEDYEGSIDYYSTGFYLKCGSRQTYDITGLYYSKMPVVEVAGSGAQKTVDLTHEYQGSPTTQAGARVTYKLDRYSEDIELEVRVEAGESGQLKLRFPEVPVDFIIRREQGGDTYTVMEDVGDEGADIVEEEEINYNGRDFVLEMKEVRDPAGPTHENLILKTRSGEVVLRHIGGLDPANTFQISNSHVGTTSTAKIKDVKVKHAFPRGCGG